MRSLEIFSGAGGLAKGLELAGFKHSALIELNKYACLSLLENFEENKVFFGDVRDFDLNSIDCIDVVAGGPPCQPFSLGGKHQANEDSRDMFPYAIQAIKKLKPKAFIFENVKGLLRPAFSDYFEYIILRLTYPNFLEDKKNNWRENLLQLRNIKSILYENVKYNIQFKLLNSADYGIPQTRERVIIIGIRSDIRVNWLFPEPSHSEDRLLWDMYVSGDYWKNHEIIYSDKYPSKINSYKKFLLKLQKKYKFTEPKLLPWKTIRDTLKDVPLLCSTHNIPDHIFKPGARSYAGHNGSDYDWPSKTIKAGAHGVPGGENMIRYADGSVRYLTVFEAKKLQTFPDDFIIKGAWGQAMRQIGNAVPVELARIIGCQLATVLLKSNEISK